MMFFNPTSATINGRVEIDGQPQPQGTATPLVDFETASLDYFRVLDIPIASGRTFTAADSEKAKQVVIVNARMARHLWPGHNPIGHRVRPVGSEDWLTVVGTIGDVHQDGLDKDPTDTLYLPLAQNPIKNARLLVRTRGNPLTLTNQVTAIVHGIDPAQPITGVQTKETPGVYESHADMEAGAWTHMKILVSGTRASLYVNGAAQPCLIVNDLKLHI
jgi:hypothetical protein